MKTKLTRINTNNNTVEVDGQEVEDVDNFDFLGVSITTKAMLDTILHKCLRSWDIKNILANEGDKRRGEETIKDLHHQ